MIFVARIEYFKRENIHGYLSSLSLFSIFVMEWCGVKLLSTIFYMNEKGNKDNEKLDKNGSVKIKPVHVMIPVVIGIGVVAWLFADEFKNFEWNLLSLTANSAIALLLAIVAVAGREAGYMWRYHRLTDGDLTWWQSFKVCMLCEFTSCVTPTAVGGSSVAMIFMNREGINFGRGTTIMIITLFLDELFFVVSCPLIVAVTPFDSLFGTMHSSFSFGLKWAFWGIYALMAVWTAILFAGIIVKPGFIKRLLVKIFSIGWLKRWLPAAESMTDNMVAASVAAKAKPFKWWLEAFVSTAFSWTCRYLLVCCLFLMFLPDVDQWIVFARQGVMWLLLLVCPTPGGSGVSEWLFNEYYSDMILSAQVSLVIAVLWRVLSYYVYLVAGLLVIPSWLKSGKVKK